MRSAALGIFSNAALVVLKGAIGIVGHSQALVADAVHSASDLLNSLIALASFLYGRRPPDWDHPYGHERAEAFASTIAGVIVAGAGMVIVRDSIHALVQPSRVPPSIFTLIAAAAAVAIKLALGRYVGAMANRTKSKSLRAEARDHIADVAVSLVVIAGIALSRLGFWWFDSVAGLCVAIFIFAAAATILYAAGRELLDTSLSPTQRQQIVAVVSAVPGVRRVQAVAGRTIGHMILVELHVDVEPTLNVAEGAVIVNAIKEHVLSSLPEVRTVVVELNTDEFEPDALRLMAPPDRRAHNDSGTPSRTR
jgi:cation diffusion facilitator family transporter